MKKVRIFIVTFAILAGVASALATRSQQLCMGLPLYYLSGGGVYTPAGTYGKDYTCVGSSGICTYYHDGVLGYVACQSGTYVSLHANSSKNKSPFHR